MSMHKVSKNINLAKLEERSGNEALRVKISSKQSVHILLLIFPGRTNRPASPSIQLCLAQVTERAENSGYIPGIYGSGSSDSSSSSYDQQAKATLRNCICSAAIAH